MTIATEKLLPASKRFQLVKITPARCVNDDLSFVSGNTYSTSFPFEHIEKVEKSGITLTEVTTFGDTNQYIWDGTTLQVNLDEAPDDNSNVIIVYYSLYYTGTKYRYHPKDPESAESASNPIVEWKPIVEKYPNVSQTIRNIRAGILTIADTSLTLANDDNEFQDYLTANDSFSNKDVTIWQCLTSVSNIQKVYKGQIKSVNLKGNKVTFGLFDPFTKLDQSAYMGDTEVEATSFASTGSYPNMNPENDSQPIPYIFGESPYSNDTYNSPPPSSSVLYDYRRELNSGMSARCNDYTPYRTNTTNREWILCRVGPNGLKTPAFGSVTRSAAYAASIVLFYCPNHTFKNGDSLTHLGDTCYVGLTEDFTYSGNTYNLSIWRYKTTATALTTNTSNYTIKPQVCVQMKGPTYGRDHRLYQSEHYTVSQTTTSGGNKLVKITLINNAEAAITTWNSFESPEVISPETVSIYFRATPADEYTHASGLKLLCDGAGLSTNAASFTAAGSALDAKLITTVPKYNATTHETVSSVCQKILESTLGYLKINTSLEVEYNLLAAPSSGDTVSADLYLNKSLGIRVDYNDIITEVFTENEQQKDFKDVEGINEQLRAIEKNNKAKYLHGLEKEYTFYHVLDRIDNRIATILAARSNRKATYTLQTATEQIDAEIGDDITLEDDAILGGSGTDNLKITSIRKDGKKVTITADDIEGL